jgi:prolyl 4-hydroxylase
MTVTTADEAVRCIDGFLPEGECQEVVSELRFSLWRPSKVSHRSLDGLVSSVRTRARRSETAMQEWFSPQVNRVVEKVEARVTDLLSVHPGHLEWWQATRYGPSDGYGLHIDAGTHAGDPAGERTHTILLYLEAPGSGGSTWFPRLGLEFSAVPGRLLVWQGLTADGRVDPRALHAAMPVGQGRKTILTTWIREHRYRSAGAQSPQQGGRNAD